MIDSWDKPNKALELYSTDKIDATDAIIIAYYQGRIECLDDSETPSFTTMMDKDFIQKQINKILEKNER